MARKRRTQQEQQLAVSDEAAAYIADALMQLALEFENTHYAVDLQVRVGKRPDDDLGVLAAAVVIRESRLGEVEDAILVGRSGELHDHLPRGNVLARFGADRSDHAVEVSLELRITELVAG